MSLGTPSSAVTMVDEDGAAARQVARAQVAVYLDVVAPLDTTVTVPDSVLAPLRDVCSTSPGSRSCHNPSDTDSLGLLSADPRAAGSCPACPHTASLITSQFYHSVSCILT